MEDCGPSQSDESFGVRLQCCLRKRLKCLHRSGVRCIQLSPSTAGFVHQAEANTEPSLWAWQSTLVYDKAPTNFLFVFSLCCVALRIVMSIFVLGPRWHFMWFNVLVGELRWCRRAGCRALWPGHTEFGSLSPLCSPASSVGHLLT